MANTPFCVGKWLPSDQDTLDRWLEDYVKQVYNITSIEESESAEEKKENALLPCVDAFKKLIEDDPEINMFFHLMFSQVPNRKPYNRTKPHVRNYHVMLRLIDHVIQHAPTFNDGPLVGAPLNAIFCWVMGTPSGHAAFLNDKVNRKLHAILEVWAKFLNSEKSSKVLNTGEKGWFNEAALKAMLKNFPGKTFEEVYKCPNPSKVDKGFESWDAFFTRQFCEGIRPLPKDDDSIIVNACESAPYRIQKNVEPRDKFWIKSQPYSLLFMLKRSPPSSPDDSIAYAKQFVGGTVYQAFLSATEYHRWHSPVNGTVKKAYVSEGNYYTEALSEGFDSWGDDRSQGYLTAVSTRAVIFIESDNADIGLMCFVAVGMAEISSCTIKVIEGAQVKKGDEIGMFRFGGSSHCLVFRPGVNVHFLLNQQPSLTSSTVPVNSIIATVRLPSCSS